MFRTLIIDDEPAIRRDLQRLLSRHNDFIEVGNCGSIAEALVLLPATRPDLVLLDIHLSDGNSFDLLRQLPEINFKIIFITACNDSAVRAIKAGAMDYILKPVDEDELQLALAKIIDKEAKHSNMGANLQMQAARESYGHNMGPIQRIALRTQQYVELVDVKDILYASSTGGYTNFHLIGGKKLLISRPLKEYEDLLPGNQFIRPHQSYLVQKSFIARYHKDGLLILKDNTEIPVASRRRDAIVHSLAH